MLGPQSDIARPKANENLHKSSPILYDTLVHLELMPYLGFASPSDLKAALQGVDCLLIDPTERAYHQSIEDTTRRQPYSEKTAYTQEHGDACS